MRLIKILGLAAIAALASMAFLVSMASADSNTIVLCNSAELECLNPSANPTTITGHAVNPQLLSSVGTVECEKSLAELTVLNELGALQIGHILALSFEGNCHLGGSSCTVTVETLGLVSFTHGKNALEGLAESTGGTRAHVECAGGFINCKYSGKPVLVATSNGSGETTLIANKTVLTEGKGFLCPKTSEWDATYTGLGTYYIES